MMYLQIRQVKVKGGKFMVKLMISSKEELKEVCHFLYSHFGYRWISGIPAYQYPNSLSVPVVLTLNEDKKQIAWSLPSVYASKERKREFFQDCEQGREYIARFTNQEIGIIPEKDTFSKEEVIEMLREMQRETAKCQGFFVGHVTQLWVIQDMLGTRIRCLGGESIDIEIR